MEKQLTHKFLVGTFLLTFGMWGMILLANAQGYSLYGTPILLLCYLLGGNAPPVIAFVVLKRAKKIDGITSWAKEAFTLKQKPQDYGMLILFVLLYFGIPGIFQGITPGIPLAKGILTIPLMIFLGGLEELGWRYHLQTALEERLPFGVATFLTAGIWALWHLPLFFMTETIQGSWNFGLFFVMILGTSFALAALWRISKSIWLCILFHSMINGLSATRIVSDQLAIRGVTSLVMIAVAFFLVNRTKSSRDQQWKSA